MPYLSLVISSQVFAENKTKFDFEDTISKAYMAACDRHLYKSINSNFSYENRKKENVVS